MINFNKKASQSGRSMIEMLGVLAIVGILSAGGIAGYSMAMQSYKTNALIEKIQLIVTKSKTIYKNGNYNGVSNQNLIDSGKLSAKDLENPFGGNLIIGSAAINTGSFYSSTGLLFVTANNTPVNTCVDVLTTDWGKEFYLFRIDEKENNYPTMSLANIITKCKVNNGGNVSLKVYFK
jgi:prepilin-type N-terminal cleavage/methylation domain-containing protein